MKNKHTKEEEQAVIWFIHSMSGLFGLTTYDATVKFESKKKGDATAMVHIDQKYMRITVWIYPLFWGEHPLDRAAALLHELCHSVTWDIEKLTKKAADGYRVTSDDIAFYDEKTTSVITNIVYTLLCDGTEKYRSILREYIKRHEKGNTRGCATRPCMARSDSTPKKMGGNRRGM